MQPLCSLLIGGLKPSEYDLSSLRNIIMKILLFRLCCKNACISGIKRILKADVNETRRAQVVPDVHLLLNDHIT